MSTERARVQRIFGWHAVLAAIEQAPERVHRVWLDEGRAGARAQAVLEAAKAGGIPLERAQRATLDVLAGAQQHQGVVAECAAIDMPHEQDLGAFLAALGTAPFLLVLDGAQDPHNLGACLRSADAAGVHAVVLPRDNAVGITPTVRKVASGAAESVPVFQVTNLARTLEELKAAGLWIAGAAGDGDRDLYSTDLRGPLALVLGAEGKGMRRLTRERCDFLVSIPMAGSVSSLNVSNAAAVCLFEAVRQRRRSGPGAGKIPPPAGQD